jgi:hypothetical protein
MKDEFLLVYAAQRVMRASLLTVVFKLIFCFLLYTMFVGSFFEQVA